MSKEEVICRFCALASKVGGEVFKHDLAHDCFCGRSGSNSQHFRFDQEVMEFIQNAVSQAIKDFGGNLTKNQQKKGVIKEN